MDKKELYIKNMVCPRCIQAVQGVLNDLNFEYQNVELGRVVLTGALSSDQRKQFSSKIEELGFELLEPGKSSLVAQIKKNIIEQIHYSDEPLNVNFSTFLSDRLHHDYSHLSRLFSSVEGITIEKFTIKQKIEKVKEMLFYDELTLSEIAFQLNYSSAAHLSAQFKKETGMTPTQFKNTHQPGHRFLDDI